MVKGEVLLGLLDDCRDDQCARELAREDHSLDARLQAGRE